MTDDLPAIERYRLVSQTRRAVVSVATNIAEGHGRRMQGAFLNHLAIAAGSLRETETCLRLIERVHPTSAAQVPGGLAECDEIGRMLTGLQRKLRSRGTDL